LVHSFAYVWQIPVKQSCGQGHGSLFWYNKIYSLNQINVAKLFSL